MNEKGLPLIYFKGDKVTYLSVLLTVVFVVLKLTAVIAWSWVWVLSPLWITLGLAVLSFGVTLLFFRSKLKQLKALRKSL